MTSDPNDVSDLVQIEAHRSPWIDRPVDNTALDQYMSCPRKFLYAMIYHRRGKGAYQRPPLSYGTSWHAMMETHYKTGGETKAVVDAAVASWQPHENPDDHRTIQRCVAEYGNFLKQYGTHDQETALHGKTVGYEEGVPIVEVPAELWDAGLIHPYTGKIDRIYEHRGLYYVEDHKTTSAMGDNYFKQFDPSNQMMGYMWLAQRLSGVPIAGVRINGHAVLKASSKFARQTIMISQPRLEEWVGNVNIWMKRLEASYKVYHEVRELPVDDPHRRAALLEAFPHNFNACAGKYGQCQYTEVCTFAPEVRDRILEAEFEVQPWNPLNPDDE